MRSAFWLDNDKQEWCLDIRVPANLLPLSFGTKTYFPDILACDQPVHGDKFTVPVGMTPGDPAPFGASLLSASAVDGGSGLQYSVNFAVYSANASAMSLCILRQGGSGGYMEIALDPTANRTGDVWHICVDGLKDIGTLCYGWRANGSVSWSEGGKFHSGYVLLDPHAPLAVPVRLPESAYAYARLLPPESLRNTDTYMCPLSHLVRGYEWAEGTGRPQRSLEQTVMLEVDVLSFTTGEDAARTVPEERRGTYLGLLDRLPELKSMGVTTLALGQVLLCSLRNGKPLSFMAPDPRFAAYGRADEVDNQLKHVIATLHTSGIEVLVKVEFCMTGEVLDEAVKLETLRGLDPEVYFRPGQEAILNTGHPVVRQLVRRAMQHWVNEYCVDGFVVVNADNLTLDRYGSVQDAPAIMDELANDPVIRGVKLVACSGNDSLLPRGGERGFPHWGVWMQWNQRFTTDAAAFLLACTPGVLSNIATRVAGSPDLFAARWDGGLPGDLAAGRRPAFGINSILAPDSGSLLDVVGHADNALQQEVVARSMLLLAMVCQGVPAFNGASVSRRGVARFVGVLSRLRRKYANLVAPPLLDSPRSVRWLGTHDGREPDWSGEQMGNWVQGSGYLALLLTNDEGSLYIGFNPHGDAAVTAYTPEPPVGTVWQWVVDTSKPPPADAVFEGGERLPGGSAAVTLAPQAAVVLQAARNTLA